MRIKQDKEKHHGVTLIELLIVVVILAALAMIALPRITRATNRAKHAVCETNQDAIHQAMELYRVDHGSYPSAIEDLTENTAYFPDGPPVCPLPSGCYYICPPRFVGCEHNYIVGEE